jgi:hypothetical protein
MDIQTTITDDQGAALARRFNITSYTDGNDLIAQMATIAYLQVQRQILIVGIECETDTDALNTVITAFMPVATTPLQGPPGMLTPATPAMPIAPATPATPIPHV